MVLEVFIGIWILGLLEDFLFSDHGFVSNISRSYCRSAVFCRSRQLNYHSRWTTLDSRWRWLAFKINFVPLYVADCHIPLHCRWLIPPSLKQRARKLVFKTIHFSGAKLLLPRRVAYTYPIGPPSKTTPVIPGIVPKVPETCMCTWNPEQHFV